MDSGIKIKIEIVFERVFKNVNNGVKIKIEIVFEKLNKISFY